MASTPKLPYTAQDTESIEAALAAFASAANPEWWTNTLASNLGPTIIQMLAMEGDKNAYGTDMLYQEQFAATQRRIEQGQRFARSVGYVPRASVASTAIIVAAALPSTIVSQGGTLAAGAVIQGTNGYNYELQSDVIFPIGISTAQLSLKEGRTLTDSFQPTEETLQEFSSTESGVEDGSWFVYIGDAADPGNLWTQVENISFEATASETYQLFYNDAGKITLRFGDGIAGKIPTETGTLIYRTTAGTKGDAAPGVIRGSLAITVVGGGGTTVSSAWVNTSSATGGLDSETILELRRSIPTFLRSTNNVISLRDFEESVVNNTSAALAFADLPLASYSGNVVRLHVWDKESTIFTATSPLGGTQSTTPYTSYAQSPSVRLFDAQQHLRTRISAGQHTAMLRPSIAFIDLELGAVVVDSKFNPATLHQDINAAVVRVFTEGTGFSLRLADLYREVLALSGVRYFTLERVEFEHIDFANPVEGVTVIEIFQQSDNAFDAPRDIVIPGTEDRVYYDDSYQYLNEFTYQDELNRTGIQCLNLRTLTFDLTIL